MEIVVKATSHTQPCAGASAILTRSFRCAKHISLHLEVSSANPISQVLEQLQEDDSQRLAAILSQRLIDSKAPLPAIIKMQVLQKPREGRSMMSRQPIEYIRSEVPEFEPLSYPGGSYEAMVPDTLNLAERAALAINALTGATDPEADYEMYFYVHFGRNKPVMSHDYSAEVQPKLQAALPLMRLISGSDLNIEVDRCWMDVTLKMQGPDGRFYFPIKGRPWYSNHCGRILDMPEGAEQVGQIGTMISNAGMLNVLSLYYLLSGDELWRKAGERLVQGLQGTTHEPFLPGDGQPDQPPTAAANGWVIQGLAKFYKTTGYEPALELARWGAEQMKQAAWVHQGGVMEDFLDNSVQARPEARIPFGWVSRPGRTPHFHGTARGLLGLLDYATAAGDQELAELVREGYEYAKILGEVQVGFFPEHVPNLTSELLIDRLPKRYETSELCSVADMIALGLKLTDAGLGDYWDEVDRWLRNQFADGQLTDVEWVYRMVEDLPEMPHDPPRQTTDRVPERNIGAFAGWPSVNDWYTGAAHYRGYYPDYHGDLALMHCCLGNCARAIYYAWERILDRQDGKLRVNLLLNRASPWADVDSYLPYEGRVDVKIKQASELAVRIPEWISPEQVNGAVNDVQCALQWKGRYAELGQVEPGDVAVVTFPLAQRRDTIYVQNANYKIERKGSEVIAIDPPGRYCPLYQRTHYRANSARWRKATRFLAEKTLRW